MGVAFRLIWFTFGYRDACTRRQCPGLMPPRRRRDLLVGPASGRDQISPRQGNFGHWVGIGSGELALHTQPLPGRLACLSRRCNIAGGHCRGGQYRVAESLVVGPQIGGSRQGCVGCGSGRVGFTAEGKRIAKGESAAPPEQHVVCCVGLGVSADEFPAVAFITCQPIQRQIAGRSRSTRRRRALGGRVRGDRVIGVTRRMPARSDVGQPPPVASFAGDADRLGEVRAGSVRAVGTDRAAGGERAGQQRWVVDFARDRHGLLGLIEVVVDAARRVEGGPIGERPSRAPPPRCRLGVRFDR